jgi:hypothetical protein
MKGAIIYISSNREDPLFEHKVIDDMITKVKETRTHMIVYAIVQKDNYIFSFDEVEGKVIGDVGTSGFNFCRQLQLAVEMADADYVISCEADCLYSPDYFTFFPPKIDTIYRNTNNYVIPYNQNYFYEKDSQTAFQIAGRDFYLDRLNFLLKDRPQWNTKMKNYPKEIGEPFLEGWETFKTRYGCFQIKTDKGMRKQTRHGKKPIRELEYWGTAKQCREEYL